MPRLLLIDDDAPFRKMLRTALELAGHTVTETSNGKEGLQLYQPSSHAVVITDLVMAEMAGLEVIREVRRRNPGARIIALSGGSRYSPDIDLDTARALGASHVFAKPFPPERLIAAVRELLAPAAPSPGTREA
ncbi:MAG TPA: response regulator [Candidatus Limnocylindria bacterium]|jgi:CheY-like chemotaxis protein|nr:response regulator [Candidatus Limnocylindria bacterium]